MTDGSGSVNGADSGSVVQASPSYNNNDPGAIVQTDSGNQSVHTTVTHGTQGTVQTASSSGNAPKLVLATTATSTSSNPSSPHRGATPAAGGGHSTTPLSMSPASTAGRSQVQTDVVSQLEPMPQYTGGNPFDRPQPMQQQRSQARMHRAHPQHGDVFLVQRQQQPVRNAFPQQQQQHLHQTFPAHRDRSNPVSELDTDDMTEPSTSGNTGSGGGEASGYTRSDGDGAGATSTFGRLIRSASKVRRRR